MPEAGDGGGEGPPEYAAVQQRQGYSSTAEPHAPNDRLESPDALSEPPSHEVEGALEEAEGDHEGGQYHEGALGDAELGFCQRRHHSAHHADGQADQKDLAQLMAELVKVFTDAVPIVFVRRTGGCHLALLGA